MPNHITNRLTINGNKDEISKVLDFIKSDTISGYSIDFNKITPTPPRVCLEGLGSDQIKKYGKENCWYEWNCKNWGTKRNAYNLPDSRSHDNIIYFTTAWSSPHDLIKKLSWIFPLLEFEIAYADEDIGSNVGIVKFKDGVVINQVEPEYGIESKKLFFEITGDSPKDHNMDSDYNYVDE